ncbi:hypothetical protein [Halochromatium roseum]|nr:hypothetical protein [Halochromatium roseum]
MADALDVREQSRILNGLNLAEIDLIGQQQVNVGGSGVLYH